MADCVRCLGLYDGYIYRLHHRHRWLSFPHGKFLALDGNNTHRFLHTCHCFVGKIWMFYKEESWLTAIFWIVLVQTLGSTSTCPFIVKELFKLNSEDPAHLILLKASHRLGYEQII
ncbi:uncharacterized protein LOC111488955 isoform X2 [Cucurbita maxima]|uniref:Uncharacterized protein LOC111488955 isoform X2 n=1 Tax=Cucurbita maxima TaxID=3661 RepID=A0A6J1JWE9_CUCMA|nr:uncharacterized protein LOC111488955 isoform X2 [Cucurbita maxima]